MSFEGTELPQEGVIFFLLALLLALFLTKIIFLKKYLNYAVE